MVQVLWLNDKFHVIRTGSRPVPLLRLRQRLLFFCSEFALSFFLQQEQEQEAELQKRADRAVQSVLIFLAGANFWEKHAKNCAFMSMAHSTYTIAH